MKVPHQLKQKEGSAVDPAVLEETVRRYGDTVYRVALQYTRSTADAEDMLQEVLLERFHAAPAFDSPEHERYWLLRVTVNKCKNLLRAQKRRRTVPLEEVMELQAPAEPERRALYEAVCALPRQHRLAVDLYYYEGYKTAEIAALLGARETTVRTWLRRGRMKLKETLKEAWDNDEL